MKYIEFQLLPRLGLLPIYRGINKLQSELVPRYSQQRTLNYDTVKNSLDFCDISVFYAEVIDIVIVITP
jgi:hypothetical protein